MKVETLDDMRAVWRKAGENGGRNRARRLSKRRRREIARMGGIAKARKERATET